MLGMGRERNRFLYIVSASTFTPGAPNGPDEEKALRGWMRRLQKRVASVYRIRSCDSWGVVDGQDGRRVVARPAGEDAELLGSGHVLLDLHGLQGMRFDLGGQHDGTVTQRNFGVGEGQALMLETLEVTRAR